MKTSYNFKKFCLLSVMGLLIFSSSGYSENDVKQSQPEGYSIAPDVVTTLQKTVVPTAAFSGEILPQDLFQIVKYGPYGYGQWTTGGPLLSEKRLDIM